MDSVKITRIWTRNGFEHGEFELILQKQQESIAGLLYMLYSNISTKTKPINPLFEQKHSPESLIQRKSELLFDSIN